MSNAVAKKVAADMGTASWILELFEKGRRLKAELGEENVYDLSLGNPQAAPARTYTWDAENRLIGVEPTPGTTVPEGAQKAAYAYDYSGRRIEKKVSRWLVQDPPPCAWVTIEHRKFVWSGWLLLLEVDCSPDVPPVETVLRKYTWGLDLAGQNGADPSRDREGADLLQAAGGIGGLLAMEDVQDPNDPNDNLNYVYMYDANGNVGQLIDWAHDPNDPNGAIVARYEYDPYGNVTAKSGSYADENPFRFSTKYFDVETGLSYFGGRYYNAALGRWLNRDPGQSACEEDAATRQRALGFRQLGDVERATRDVALRDPRQGTRIGPGGDRHGAEPQHIGRVRFPRIDGDRLQSRESRRTDPGRVEDHAGRPRGRGRALQVQATEEPLIMIETPDRCGRNQRLATVSRTVSHPRRTQPKGVEFDGASRTKGLGFKGAS
jgi:RHS repeat-associated protein